MEKSEETQKNWLKRFERKVAEGRIGKFISWFDGRIGNKVYECSVNTNFKFSLYRKFKNATKAKRFMEGVK